MSQTGFFLALCYKVSLCSDRTAMLGIVIPITLLGHGLCLEECSVLLHLLLAPLFCTQQIWCQVTLVERGKTGGASLLRFIRVTMASSALSLLRSRNRNPLDPCKAPEHTVTVPCSSPCRREGWAECLVKQHGFSQQLPLCLDIFLPLVPDTEAYTA